MYFRMSRATYEWGHVRRMNAAHMNMPGRVFVYINTHTHMHTHIHIHTHRQTHTNTHTRTHKHEHILAHSHTHTHSHIFKNLCTRHFSLLLLLWFSFTLSTLLSCVHACVSYHPWIHTEQSHSINNTLQHTTAHCNTLQRTATQHTVTHCNTAHCSTLQHNTHRAIAPIA